MLLLKFIACLHAFVNSVFLLHGYLICDFPLLNHSHSPHLPPSVPPVSSSPLSLPLDTGTDMSVLFFFPKNYHLVCFILSVSLTFCFIYFASSVYRYLLCFGDLLFFFFNFSTILCLMLNFFSFICM